MKDYEAEGLLYSQINSVLHGNGGEATVEKLARAAENVLSRHRTLVSDLSTALQISDIVIPRVLEAIWHDKPQEAEELLLEWQKSIHKALRRPI